MKRSIVIVVALLLFFNVACTSEQVSSENKVKTHKEYHVFQGQSENWEGKIIADYKETFTEVEGKWKYESKNNNGSKGYLRYKGSDIDSVENIFFEVINGAEKLSGTKGKLHLSNEIEIGAGVYRSDDIFNVTIKWNGKEESFDMKAIKSKITD